MARFDQTEGEWGKLGLHQHVSEMTAEGSGARSVNGFNLLIDLQSKNLNKVV